MTQFKPGSCVKSKVGNRIGLIGEVDRFPNPGFNRCFIFWFTQSGKVAAATTGTYTEYYLHECEPPWFAENWLLIENVLDNSTGGFGHCPSCALVSMEDHDDTVVVGGQLVTGPFAAQINNALLTVIA